MSSQGNNIPSEGPRIDSESLRELSGITGPDADLMSLEGNLARDVVQSGSTVIFTPNDIKIERIPFSKEDRIRIEIR